MLIADEFFALDKPTADFDRLWQIPGPQT